MLTLKGGHIGRSEVQGWDAGGQEEDFGGGLKKGVIIANTG